MVSYSFSSESFDMEKSKSTVEDSVEDSGTEKPMSEDSVSNTSHSDADSTMEDAESEEISEPEDEEEDKNEEVEEDDDEPAEEYERYWQYTVVQRDSRAYTPPSNYRRVLGIFTDREKALERMTQRIDQLKINGMWGKFFHIVPLSNDADGVYGKILESASCGSVEVSIEKEWVKRAVSGSGRSARKTPMTKTKKKHPQNVFIVLVQQKDLKTGTLIKSDVHPKSFLSVNNANRHAAQVWKLASMSEKEIQHENLSEGSIFNSPERFAPAYLGELEVNGELFHRDFVIYRGEEKIKVILSVRKLEVVHQD
ncbi:hypothetical protein VTN77DRAFT_6992 [Rasamsonia byssochlamydoides]|uniref:uncharacterized protein n=1 Tax=Rasamsonia byssochlamydoides TaxID=89139 RepID=UPI00374437D8